LYEYSSVFKPINLVRTRRHEGHQVHDFKVSAPASQPTTTRFYVRLRSDVLRDTNLSDGAVRTYGLLLDESWRSLRRDRAEVTEEQLAAALGRSKRTVQLYLGELAAAGLVEIRKIGRRNIYLLRCLAPNLDEEQAQSVAPIENERVQPIAPIEAEQAQDFAPPLRQQSKDESSSNERAAAAEQSEEIRKATEALVNDIGMHRERAEFFARRDPGLALVGLAFLRWRIDQGYTPKSKIGLLCCWLKYPDSAGFVNVDGVWRPPPEFEAVAAVKRAADDAAEHRAAKDRQSRDEMARDRHEANERNPFAEFSRARAEREGRRQ
jgi:DNA-binding transcriptional ArsR family regulator